MKRKIMIFCLAIILGIGWADYCVHRMQDGVGSLTVYGWQMYPNRIEGIWMGESYSLLRWDRADELIVTAGGLDYNVTDGIDEVTRFATEGYHTAVAFWQTVWE